MARARAPLLRCPRCNEQRRAFGGACRKCQKRFGVAVLLVSVTAGHVRWKPVGALEKLLLPLPESFAFNLYTGRVSAKNLIEWSLRAA